MTGSAVFLQACLAIAVTGAAVATGLRARGQHRRWDGWQQLAADRGLQATTGDPLGIGPLLSGSGPARSVQRTLSGMVDGIPVAVVLTVGLAGSAVGREARSDLVGLARVGTPVHLDRIHAGLQHMPDVGVGSVGDFAVLEPRRGLRLAVDHPPADEAARLFDLAARAGRAALDGRC